MSDYMFVSKSIPIIKIPTPHGEIEIRTPDALPGVFAVLYDARGSVSLSWKMEPDTSEKKRETDT